MSLELPPPPRSRRVTAWDVARALLALGVAVSVLVGAAAFVMHTASTLVALAG